MRVTIIPSDRFVRRDDIAVKLPKWPFDDATIHAIQWNETKGEIEHRESPPRNEEINDPAVLTPYLDALDAYLVEMEAVAAAAAEPTPELTTEQKLEAAGLTVAELKELFGLS